MERIEPGLYSYRRYRPLQRPESVASPIVRLLGARVYAIDGRRRVVEMPGPSPPLPRVSLHGRWEVLPEEEILRRLATPGFAPDSLLLIEREPPVPQPVAPPSGVADIQEYGPDRVLVRASCDGPACLLLTDAWYPGWEVTVDGSPADLYRADYAFRAVFLPPGDHVVDFRYRPESFRHGTMISCATLVFAALLFAAGRRGKE